jgi:hypothetical protein
MTNREKYQFDEFTFEKYPKHIELALKNGFEFVGFQDNYEWSRKLVLWRHDVEFSPWVALRMSKIEKSLGVKASYFFQTHSEFYNLYERAVVDIALEIADMGHYVGLHYDPHFWGLDDEPDSPEKVSRMSKTLQWDADFFGKAVGVEPNVFSFHLTNRFTMSCEEMRYAGLINVYSKFFKEHFAYNGDSNGWWKFEKMDDRFTNADIRHVQILTHDANWTDKPMAPRQRGFLAIDQIASHMRERYDAILKNANALNIDEDKIL